IDARVDVGIKPVLARTGLVPGGLRLRLDETDLDDRLRALEAVLPRHHQAQRRAVLVRQHLAVQADREQGQRMHRLIQPQAFDVRPFEAGAEQAGALARHLRRIVQRGELDVLGARRRLDALDHAGEWDADPRYHHRPRLDTAQPVNAFLERERFQEIFQMIYRRLLHLAFDRDAPRARAQALGAFDRIVLVGAELVEVVIARDVVVRRELLVGGDQALRGRKPFARRGAYPRPAAAGDDQPGRDRA